MLPSRRSVSAVPDAARMTTPDPDPFAPAPTRPTWVRWRIVFILMAFTGLNHFHRQSLPAVGDQLMDDCGFVPTDLGWINSTMLLGYTLFMVGGGWLSDRRGAWYALVLSGFVTAALV